MLSKIRVGIWLGTGAHILSLAPHTHAQLFLPDSLLLNKRKYYSANAFITLSFR